MMYADYLLVPVTLYCVLFGLECVSGVQFVLEPADVTKTYTYGSAVTGDSFFLDCRVDSLEADQKVSWFKNGYIISDGYIFRDDVKVRLVDVTNDRYRISAFNTPLRFTLQVRSVSSSTAEFDSGSYQCAVTWWQNDAAVPGGRSRTASVSIYVIPTSNYPFCRASNPNGHDVITAGPTTTATIIVLSGITYTLTCLSSQSTPIATLFWSRNDQSGSLPRKTTGDDNGLLYVTYDWIPSRNDGSTLTFTCTLQHPGLSSDRTCSVTFTIQYAPIVTIDPTDVMVTEENDEIVLHCNQDANPQVTETVWYYDDDVVNSGGRFSLEGMSLRILEFSPSENGDHAITCELTNVIGTGSDSVTLTVDIQYAPIVTIDPTDVMVTEENDEIVLHCNQDANPQVTETVWYYDDDVVNSGGRFRLEGTSLRILRFSSCDNGDYTITCELTNSMGTGSESVPLTVDIQCSSTKQLYSQRPKTELFSKMITTATDNTHTTSLCQQYCVSERDAGICPQTATKNIWLSVGLLFVGLIVGVFSTTVACFFMNKRGLIERTYGNNSNLTDNVKSRDDIELNTKDNPGIESDMNNDDEQNYQIIREYDATTVKTREESKVTDTVNYTNIPSRQFAGEDEHYQSLGKQSDSVYTGLTTDNKIESDVS